MFRGITNMFAVLNIGKLGDNCWRGFAGARQGRQGYAKLAKVFITFY